MRSDYQVVDSTSKLGSRELAEFLSKEGQLLLPLLDLVTQGQRAIDEVIDVMGRATIEAILKMSAAEVAALGGPRAEGIFVRRLNAARNGNNVVFTWNAGANVRLQKSNSLSNPDWQDVSGTLGAGAFTETAPEGIAFYRLAGF